MSKLRIKDNMYKKTHLFLFNWDDTLFPRTVIYNNQKLPNQNTLPVSILLKINMIEEIVLDMFNKINSFGTIVIISNSDKKWIMTTAKLY